MLWSSITDVHLKQGKVIATKQKGIFTMAITALVLYISVIFTLV